MNHAIHIRRAVESDLPAIKTFDERSNKDANPRYWQEMFTRYGADKTKQLFLVCEKDAEIIGFIIGEIRDWEFGSHPCGWIFALGVRPDIRLSGIATQMYTVMCDFFRGPTSSWKKTCETAAINTAGSLCRP